MSVTSSTRTGLLGSLSLAVASLVTAAGCAEYETPRAVAPAVVYVAPPTAGPPTMPYENFLSELSDPQRRQWLWGVFQAGERQAYAFAAAPQLFVPLTRVNYIPPGGKAGDWNPSGRIELVANADAGVLFHEIFHTVYHRSVLHAGSDVHWKEAFCDAFRYLAERELLPPPPSNWTGKIENFERMSFEEVRRAGGGAKWKAVYTYPASLIVRRAGGTMAGFRALWFGLIEARERAGRDILDDFFGYAPQTTYREWQEGA